MLFSQGFHSPSGSREAFQSPCRPASGIPTVVHRLDSIVLLWFATCLTAEKEKERKKEDRIKFSISSNWRIYRHRLTEPHRESEMYQSEKMNVDDETKTKAENRISTRLSNCAHKKEILNRTRQIWFPPEMCLSQTFCKYSLSQSSILMLQMCPLPT